MKKNINKNTNIITIDGPAGSGKSTIAKMLARELGMVYIDTGAMYRALTLLALENGIDLNDEDSILEKARKVNFKFDNKVSDLNKYTKVFLNDRDITLEIRSKEVGNAVSIVSKLSKIRRYLVNFQRNLAYKHASVLEGRDTGSVVCPDAVCKIFLTASIDERVNRREKQLQIHNQQLQLTKEQIKGEIQNRDKIDSSREDSPLIIPEGAVVIDTTFMSIQEVFDKIKSIYLKKLNSK